MNQQPKQLTRSVRDKMFFGVCSGLAHYLNTDPTIVRVVMVLAVLFGSLGIWLYLVLAIIMPADQNL